MARVLREGICSIVNGKEKKPATREREQSWITKKMIKLLPSELLLSVITIFTISLESSFNAANCLEELFVAQGKFSKINLKIDFFELSLKENESFAAHVNHMSLMTKLVAIDAPIAKDIAIAVLLKSMLDYRYGPTVTTLKNLPSPTLGSYDFAPRGRKFEKEILATSSKESLKGFGINKGKGELKCNFCGRTNHMEKD